MSGSVAFGLDRERQADARNRDLADGEAADTPGQVEAARHRPARSGRSARGCRSAPVAVDDRQVIAPPSGLAASTLTDRSVSAPPKTPDAVSGRRRSKPCRPDADARQGAPADVGSIRIDRDVDAAGEDVGETRRNQFGEIALALTVSRCPSPPAVKADAAGKSRIAVGGERDRAVEAAAVERRPGDQPIARPGAATHQAEEYAVGRLLDRHIEGDRRGPPARATLAVREPSPPSTRLASTCASRLPLAPATKLPDRLSAAGLPLVGV